MTPALWWCQVIDLEGGVNMVTGEAVPVNRRMAVTVQGPEHWCYDAGLWRAIAAADRNTTGTYGTRYQWIKE